MELEIISENLGKEAGSLRHWDATKTYDCQLKIKIKERCKNMHITEISENQMIIKTSK